MDILDFLIESYIKSKLIGIEIVEISLSKSAYYELCNISHDKITEAILDENINEVLFVNMKVCDSQVESLKISFIENKNLN